MLKSQNPQKKRKYKMFLFLDLCYFTQDYCLAPPIHYKISFFLSDEYFSI